MLRIQDFDDAAAEGLVSCVERGPLALYCYTARCAHERLWTPVTRAARGIIFDRRTGEMVARPFDKFFNLGEMPETQPEALPSDGFTVEEKLDGSLGIIFYHEGRWDIATKGAFDSPQAQYAREELLPRYDLSLVHERATVLAEIIYPENRIVVDYGDYRGLVSLTARDLDSGEEWTNRWLVSRMTGMPQAPMHDFANFLDLPHPEENHEGYVVRFRDGHRVKVKSPRYVAIHRLLEYRSPRRILDMIADGSYEEVRAQIPDAIAGDFDDVSATLRMSIRQVVEEVRGVYDGIAHLGDRKTFALAAKEKASSRALPLVFAMRDGKDVEALAVRAVRKEIGGRW